MVLRQVFSHVNGNDLSVHLKLVVFCVFFWGARVESGGGGWGGVVVRVREHRVGCQVNEGLCWIGYMCVEKNITHAFVK